MAPELFTKKQSNASPALDVWSLGCILYALLTGNLPFRGDKSQDLKNKIVNDPHHVPLVQKHLRRSATSDPKNDGQEPRNASEHLEITDHAWTNGRQFTAEEKEKIKQQELLYQAIAKEAALKEKERMEEETGGNPSPVSYSGGFQQHSNSPKKFPSVASSGPASHSKFRSFGNLTPASQGAGDGKKTGSSTPAGGKKTGTTPNNGPKPNGGHK